MKEMLSILVWPICVVACFVFACVWFRRQLASLLDRTTHVGKDGIKTADISLAETQAAKDKRANVFEQAIIRPGLRFLLTTPLSGIGTQEQYDAFMARMAPILARIRTMKGVDHVYYFNELVPTIDEFHKDKWSVPDYLNEIQQADYMILIVNTSTVSSVYFEAGYALANAVKAIYFVGTQGKIPHLMEQCAFTYPKLVRHQTFTSLDEIPELLRRIMPVLQNEEPNKPLHRIADKPGSR